MVLQAPSARMDWSGFLGQGDTVIRLPDWLPTTPLLGRDKARCLVGTFPHPPVENRTCDFHRIRLSTFRSVLVFALWHDVHIGWRCFMRSASVVSLNRARGITWSTSTSLGWSCVPHT